MTYAQRSLTLCLASDEELSQAVSRFERLVVDPERKEQRPVYRMLLNECLVEQCCREEERSPSQPFDAAVWASLGEAPPEATH